MIAERKIVIIAGPNGAGKTTLKLIFLQLPSAEVAIARVASRVSQGGHNVAEAVIRRRFHSGLRNFAAIYRPIVDSWSLYDNSGESPRLLQKGYAS